MFKANISKWIKDTGIMAIVRVDNDKRGEEIARGCLEGGVDVLEISYTISTAGDTIKHLSKLFGDRLLIGAGTILDSETARLAIISGAKFIIAPNFNKEVAMLCNRYQIPYAPGCTTLSEMIEAMEYGAAFAKLFPISSYVGPSIVKTLKTPVPNMPLMGSGGVTLENVSQWFESEIECVGVGTLLTKGSKDEIAKNATILRSAVINARKKERTFR